MDAGDTLLFLDAPRKHLWVVVSDPQKYSDDPVVLVSFTTARDRTDPTCVLGPEDHEFIKHPTAVSYAKARTVPKGTLEALLRSYRVELREPLSSEVLERIRRGAAVSLSRIPEVCRQILLKQGLIE